jgi:hypothetical protein
MELTDTSYTFVKQTLKDTRREGVLRRRTRLLCQECGEVRQAIDVFPNGEVLMSPCQHRRPMFLRKSAEVTAYDTATREREKRKLISCRSHHGTYVRVFVEEIEQAA